MYYYFGVEEILARLRASGHRESAPRRAVIEALAARDRAFTVQEIADALAPRGIGRATVFRAVNTLEELGFVNRLHVGQECDRYTLCTPSRHHHHLVCTGCGDVFPIEACPIDDAAAEAARRVGFSIQGHHVDVYGACAACAAPGA